MTMDKPKLLDLFCKAGGAGRGYQLAGFRVTGVDIEPQPRYAGDVFIQADALAYVAQYGWMYDAIHASPPCEKFTNMQQIRVDAQANIDSHLNLIPHTRYWLEALGLPYIIENVEGAKNELRDPIFLCGTMFSLKVLRHRYFESNIALAQPVHPEHIGSVANGDYCGVYGSGGAMWRDKEKTVRRSEDRSLAAWKSAMGIDWMLKSEINKAIPPAYTQWLGVRLMRHIAGEIETKTHQTAMFEAV